MYDYKKLLMAYINHVGEMEGVNFLYWRHEPVEVTGLTTEERDELIRVSQQSKDNQ